MTKNSSPVSPLALTVGIALLCTSLPLLAPDSGADPMPPADGAPNELLVRFAEQASSGVRAATRDAYGTHFRRQGRRGDWEVVQLPPYADRRTALTQYAQDPHVAHVEPNRRVRSAGITPDDTHFDNQWALPRVALPEAWGAMDKPGHAGNVVIAVLDTGTELDHPDLVGNLWQDPDPAVCAAVDEYAPCGTDSEHGWNFLYGRDDDYTHGRPDDDDGHGTHVAGIAGAVGDNELGIAGAAWDVRLMSLKFLDSSGFGTLDAAIDAIDYAIDKGADIINASYAVGPIAHERLPTDCDDFRTPNQPENANYLQCEALARAGDNGILVVAAAGNNGREVVADRLILPAAYPLDNLVSVAATTEAANDPLASYSNFGPFTVHIGAPGDNILSTTRDEKYVAQSGTSMATPLVGGILALLLETDSDGAGHRHVRERLLGTIAEREGLAETTLTGGRVDAFAALTKEIGTIPPVPPSHLSLTQQDNGLVDLLWFSSSPSAGGIEVQRRDPESGTFTTLATLAADSGGYTDTSPLQVDDADEVRYRIRTLGSASRPDSRWVTIGASEWFEPQATEARATTALAEQFQGFEGAEPDLRCFIATAAYGGNWGDEVEQLRTFRDEVLLNHPLGQHLVSAYYRLSPPLANWIAQSEARRAATRRVLTPLLGLLEQTRLEQEHRPDT